MNSDSSHTTFQIAERTTRFWRLKKLLLLVGGLLFTVCLAEGLLRLYPPLRPLPRTYVGDYENRPNRNWVADPLIGWKLRPHLPLGGVETNAQGFRSPRDFDSDQPCQRIAIAGDSFTYGIFVSYQKTFASLTEVGFPGSCVENMGLPGYGLDQIWQTVRAQAIPIHPRLVVVAFINDDFTRSEEAYRSYEGFNKPTFTLVNGTLVRQTTRDRPNSLVRFLQHHSSLWRAAQLANRTLAHYYPYGEWWHLNAAILDQIQDDCRRAGIPVLFIYIPTRDWGAFPTLRAYMASEHANFIDLSQGEFALAPEMYLPTKDGHLNERGHQQVADALLYWLKQNLSKPLNSASGAIP
jgi:hypothetical protein